MRNVSVYGAAFRLALLLGVLTAPDAAAWAAGSTQSSTPSAVQVVSNAAKTQPAEPAISGSPQSNVAMSTDQGITLNFVNADVRDVAKAILGDYLKLNYEIGANVQGTVTLQSSQPLARAQVLPALEQALSLNDMALVNSNGIYQVMPLADAHKRIGVVRNTSGPGYGVEVVHVKYVTAEQMQRLLQPFATSEGAVRVDTTRNLLIIEGTAQERNALIEDASMLDADWLSGMSFALLQPNYMDAEELMKELDPIIGGPNGAMAGVVHLVPIDRLNAVLAISSQPRYLAQLRAWLARLDKPGNGTDKKIFVYHVQNGRAVDVANTLLKVLFGPGAPQQADTQPQNNSANDNQNGNSTSGANSNVLNSSNRGSSAPGLTNNFATGDLTGGTAPSHPSTPATSFDAVTSPAQEQTRESRGYETVGGVSREGINSVHITADQTNNALVILATPREYGVIEDALHQLDVAPIQVLLEAAIAEVTLTDETKYGFQYFAQNSHNQGVLTQSSTLPVSTSPLMQIAPSLPGFSYMFMNGNNIQIILNALGTVTHVEVISSPEVMVLNNQMASLEVGDQVPILTGQSQSTIGTNSPIVNSIEYLDTGVILRVTPRVNRSGQVMMDISQEVSGVSNTASSAIGSPTIQQRKVNSSVAVTDGETVALGGLFSDSLTLGHNGIPFLQDIPVLGNLFRTTDNSHNKTELMVLITPHVVDDAQKARAITDELRRKLPELQPLFEKHD